MVLKMHHNLSNPHGKQKFHKLRHRKVQRIPPFNRESKIESVFMLLDMEEKTLRFFIGPENHCAFIRQEPMSTSVLVTDIPVAVYPYVSNEKHSFAVHVENGLEIPSFSDDCKDLECGIWKWGKTDEEVKEESENAKLSQSSDKAKEK
jgi:hypothetical protein